MFYSKEGKIKKFEFELQIAALYSLKSKQKPIFYSREHAWLLWLIFVGKFYFILINCLYYFHGMNVKIESLMLGVL